MIVEYHVETICHFAQAFITFGLPTFGLGCLLMCSLMRKELTDASQNGLCNHM